MSRLPLIGIPADRRLCGKHYFHMVGEKYIEAIALGASALPVLIPALGSDLDVSNALETFDGFLFTGSASNVEPRHYGGPASQPGTLHDPDRDNTTLPLIPRAIAAGIPVLAVCRGFQEMNVAYGGTLHQRLHESTGFSIIVRMRRRRSRFSTGRRTTCCWSLEGPCTKSPDRIACGSIRCTGREWTGWARIWKSRRGHRTASSRRSGWLAHRVSPWESSGILNGSLRKTPYPARCLQHLVKPPDNRASISR